MNQINIKYKKPLKGEITSPPDKSISHRAVIISSLADGKSIIRNFLYAEDPMRTVNAFREMGIEIEEKTQSTENKSPHYPPLLKGGEGGLTQNAELIIHGKGLKGLKAPKNTIDCGNSGTTMRLLCGALAGQIFSSTLKGDASLSRRPMQRVIMPLTEMGAVIKSEKGGYPPLNIKGTLSVPGGKLKPIQFQSPVASAQVKSAILFAGLYCDGITCVSEPEKSRDHTERMLKAAGVSIEIKNLKVSVTGKAKLKPLETTIPGDFSSAAFFIAAGAIVRDSEILIENTGINPTRTGLLEILEMMGADITLENKRDESGEPVADIVVKHSQLRGIKISGKMITRAIDEFPILCVAASVAKGTTKITGAKELRVKESDRIASMTKELRKMGVDIEELEDGVIIEGREQLKAATVQSYGDHRVAMALIVAGLVADGETIIQDTECINTSFPGFVEMLGKLQE